MKTGQIGGEVLFSSGAKKELHGRWVAAHCPPPRALAAGTLAGQSPHA
jgi:hypothetical protein